MSVEAIHEQKKGNVQIWNVEKGEIKSIKIDDFIFNVTDEGKDENLMELAERFSKTFDLNHENKDKTSNIDEYQGKQRYSKRVSSERRKKLTPLLNDEGQQERVNGIPLYEEFKNVLFENFKHGEEFETQDVVDLFIDNFPEYSPLTLKNMAVAYKKWLLINNKAEITEIEGVKRKMALKKVSMSDEEIQDLKVRQRNDRKILMKY